MKRLMGVKAPPKITSYTHEPHKIFWNNALLAKLNAYRIEVTSEQLDKQPPT
jgi:hypothetical protein